MVGQTWTNHGPSRATFKLIKRVCQIWLKGGQTNMFVGQALTNRGPTTVF